MNLKEKLSKRIDKVDLLEIVQYCLEKPDTISELMECFFISDNKMDQMAAWIVPYIAQKDEKLLVPYYERILDYIDGPVHTGVQRNAMRMFEEVEIPEEIEGRLYEKCMEYITNPKLPVALPAFAITVGLKICKKYPELSHEFLEVVRSLYEMGSPAIRVRVRRAVKALSKKNH